MHTVTLWTQIRSAAQNHTPLQSRHHSNKPLHTEQLFALCFTLAAISFSQRRQILNHIYFLFQTHSHFTVCFYICFGALSCILSYRNSRNQAAFVQQFLSNLHLPLPSPCFSPLVSTCLEIKELSAGRRTNAQSDRDRQPEVKYNSIKSATVDKSASSNSARDLYFCKRYAVLHSIQ